MGVRAGDNMEEGVTEAGGEKGDTCVPGIEDDGEEISTAPGVGGPVMLRMGLDVMPVGAPGDMPDIPGGMWPAAEAATPSFMYCSMMCRCCMVCCCTFRMYSFVLSSIPPADPGKPPAPGGHPPVEEGTPCGPG